jgi:hypothetical protein
MKVKVGDYVKFSPSYFEVGVTHPQQGQVTDICVWIDGKEQPQPKGIDLKAMLREIEKQPHQSRDGTDCALFLGLHSCELDRVLSVSSTPFDSVPFVI